MPDFDPTVPLHVDASPINSLGGFAAADSFAKTQSDLLAAQNARMTLAAKQQAGALIASSPDLASGIDSLMKDPMTAAFAPDIASTLQAIHSSQVSMQGEQQNQSLTGFQAVLKSLLPALKDPTTFDANVAAVLPTLSPSASQSVLTSLPSIKAALLEGLPAGEAAGPAYQQRLSAMLVGAGVPPDSIRSVSGNIAPQVITATDSEGRVHTKIAGGPMTGPQGAAWDLAVGPTSEEQATMSSTGSAITQLDSDMAADAEGIPATAIKLNSIIGALGEFQAGGGADIRAGLAKGAQAFKNMGVTGITDKMINDIGNGSLSASQFFTANIRPFVIHQLKDAAQGTGRVMRSEVDAFLSMADSTNDPVALLGILNQAKKFMQIGYDRSQKYLTFKQDLKDGDPVAEHFGPLGFDQWYTDQLDESKLPTKTSGGIDLSQVPASKVRGVTSESAPATDTKSKLDAIFGGQ